MADRTMPTSPHYEDARKLSNTGKRARDKWQEGSLSDDKAGDVAE